MARRKRHEEHENHERWLVSYADFITLLFAFFTVLYATSEQDAKKVKEFESSVRRSFAGVMGFGMPMGEYDTDRDASSPFEPPIQLHRQMNTGPAEVQDSVVRSLQNEVSKEDYEKYIQGVTHDALGVRIQLAASALFPSASADLRADSARVLDRIGEMLQETDRRVIIEGHTDNEPVSTNRFFSNWELSAARATRVVRYMMKRHGIEGKRMAAVAYADQKPLAPNITDAGRAKNRRIEILIVTNGDDS